MLFESIANKIKKKLPDPSVVNEFERCFQQKKENTNICIHFLLKTACEFNLLEEIHDLLELNLFEINQTLEFEKFTGYNDSGRTLLGLAAFYGHYDMVAYLIEFRKANPNAKDAKGNTSLHLVVHGDAYPFHGNNGAAHDKIAKYLLRYGGDLFLKNNNGQTPYDNTKWCAPLKIENMIGRRFITNTGSALYYADKVRPVFEKELARLKKYESIPVIRLSSITNTEFAHQEKSFEQFCLEHAVEKYIKNKNMGFGYPDFHELSKALDALTEDEWKQMEKFIASNNPTPYSFKFGLISKELPKFAKQSVLLGLAVAFITYYETQSILLSVNIGTLSAALAWNYLTDRSYNNKVNKREAKYERINDLQKHNRFFKPIQIYTGQHVTAGDLQHLTHGVISRRG